MAKIDMKAGCVKFAADAVAELLEVAITNIYRIIWLGLSLALWIYADRKEQRKKTVDGINEFDLRL